MLQLPIKKEGLRGELGFRSRVRHCLLSVAYRVRVYFQMRVRREVMIFRSWVARGILRQRAVATINRSAGS